MFKVDASKVGSTGYAMRASTVAKTEESKKKTSPYRKNRTVLPLTATASIVRESGHDCKQLEVQNTSLKVNARFFFSMFRFTMAYAWECDTFRGRTHYNGAQSHCERCEAAHAALSPTLYDNKMELVTEKVEKVGYKALDEADRDYIDKRFALVEDDRAKLSDADENVRFDHMTYIASRLTDQEKLGSFINTLVEQERNTTFDNPRASNRIDCHLEHALRPLEDNLANECKKNLKTPKEALQTLQTHHKELLKALEDRLLIDSINIDVLSDSWQLLMNCQKEVMEAITASEDKSVVEKKFISYLNAVSGYLEAYDVRFKQASRGAPHLKELREHLDKHQPQYVLKLLSKYVLDSGDLTKAMDRFRANLTNLKMAEDSEQLFQEAKEEIEQRRIETYTQLAVIDRPFETLHETMKTYFGAKKDASGTPVSPTRTEMAKQLKDSLPSLSPTRSDLKTQRSKKRVLKDISNTSIETTPPPPSKRAKIEFENIKDEKGSLPST